MNLPRRAYLLALSVSLLAVAGIWIALSRPPAETKSVQAEVTFGGLTEDDREELRKRGLVVLRRAQNLEITNPQMEGILHWGMSYELDVEGSFEDVIDALNASLEQMGWSLDYEGTPFSGAPPMWRWENARGNMLAWYTVEAENQEEPGPATRITVSIAATSARPRPTPTPERRPIS